MRRAVQRRVCPPAPRAPVRSTGSVTEPLKYGGTHPLSTWLSSGSARGATDLLEQFQDRFELERLAEVGATGGLEEGLRAGIRQVAGREDEPAGHRRLDPAESLVETLAVEARHLEIGQDGVVVVRGGELERFLSVARVVDLVADGL